MGRWWCSGRSQSSIYREMHLRRRRGKRRSLYAVADIRRANRSATALTAAVGSRPRSWRLKRPNLRPEPERSRGQDDRLPRGAGLVFAPMLPLSLKSSGALLRQARSLDGEFQLLFMEPSARAVQVGREVVELAAP